VTVDPLVTGATGVEEVRAIGPRALLAEVADPAAALDLARWLRAEGVLAEEVVPAARTVLLDGLVAGGVEQARRLLARWRPGAAGEAVAAAPVELPVRYDGPDLEVVARSWGCGTAEVVRRHTAIEFVSAFCGFAPGFAYLAGLPAEFAVPRLDSPRSRVPAGAVALADAWCGVYPTSSPGGWQILGSTDATLWDPGREPPALLAPGTRVRFVERR
jgi:KipI family sensor histidine kinase inhibitor